MILTLLKGKLHRATVTMADMDYEGSITLDPELYRMAGLLPYEQVDVLNINNGARFTTYVIDGTPGQREVQVNGAAARLVQKGDKLIIIAYAQMDAERARTWQPHVVLLDDNNQPKSLPTMQPSALKEPA